MNGAKSMTNKEHLIEQHIREYESRMKHIDELYQRAHQAAAKLATADDACTGLDELTAQRSLLRETTESIKTMHSTGCAKQRCATPDPWRCGIYSPRNLRVSSNATNNSGGRY